jgi:ribosome-associated protein
MEKVTITTEFIKLDQFLKWVGIAENGAHSKEIILEGIVKVNGEVELRRGRKVRAGDQIDIKGETFIVEQKEEK